MYVENKSINECETVYWNYNDEEFKQQNSQYQQNLQKGSEQDGDKQKGGD